MMLTFGTTQVLAAMAGLLGLVGAAGALLSASALKRVLGALVALIGALVLAAALGAPEAALSAGAAIAFAYLAVGAALVVRAQEAYGGVDLAAIDAADRADDEAGSSA